MPRSIRFFIHNRWIESIATISSSGEQTDHEAVLTKTMALAETWRSTGLAAPYLSASLGAQRRIGAVCIVKSNLTNAALFRVTCSNTANFAVLLYDSGWNTRKRYFSDNEIFVAKTSEFFPGGLPITDLQKRIQRQVIIIQLPTEVTAGYVKVEFNDPTNPDGYIEIPYVYAGLVLESSNDVLFNWKLQRDDFVRDGQAACGQYWSSSVYNRTLMTFTMAPQRESDLTGYWLLLESLVSINYEFIVSLLDRTNTQQYVTSIYGRFPQVATNTNLAFLHWGMSWAVEELVD